MNKRLKQDLIGWGYILPSFIVLITFIIAPIFMSVYFSFTDYNGINAPKFTGISNYTKMLNDQYIMISIKNTIYYTFITVPLQTIVSLGLAAIIASKFRNKFGEWVKSSLFVPVISSAILVGTLWTLLLSTDNGVINNILGMFRIPNINWLGQRSTALLSVCIVAIWKNVGYFLVIFYAGLMNVPASYYEAADVDGATKIQQFLHITLPCVKPITYLVVTLGVIWSFQVFDVVYAMTQGGPGSATTTLVYTIYNAAFREYRMGYASAVAVLLVSLILLCNVIQKQLFKEKL
ncbi:MAG: sugar ABC transporter permease [Eubacteriales bacterium]